MVEQQPQACLTSGLPTLKVANVTECLFKDMATLLQQLDDGGSAEDALAAATAPVVTPLTDPEEAASLDGRQSDSPRVQRVGTPHQSKKASKLRR